MNIQEMEIKLWDYIDGTISIAEKPVIEKLIEENKEWKSKYAELTAVNQLLNATELENPPLRFTKTVMEQIAKLHVVSATKKYINNKIIWGIAAFFIALIAGVLVYVFAQINWSAPGNGNSTPGIDFSQIDYHKIFNNSFINAFMMLPVVLGLLLVDRYLNIKKKRSLQKAGL